MWGVGRGRDSAACGFFGAWIAIVVERGGGRNLHFFIGYIRDRTCERISRAEWTMRYPMDGYGNMDG